MIQSSISVSKKFFSIFLCLGFFHIAFAQDDYVSFKKVENAFPLNSVTLFLDSEDHEGVHLVAEDLQANA